MVQGGNAEVDLAGQVLDAQWPLIVVVEPADGLAHAVGLAVGQGNFVQPVALRAAQQAVENLPAHQRCQHGDVAWRVEQAEQAQQGIEQRAVSFFHVQAAPIRAIGYQHRTAVGDQLADLGRVQVHAQPQARALRAGVELDRAQRQGDRNHHVVQRVVGVLFVPEEQAFAALGQNAQRRLRQGRYRANVLGVAHQEQVVDGRGRPIRVACMASDQVGQLLALDLQVRIKGRGDGHGAFLC